MPHDRPIPGSASDWLVEFHEAVRLAEEVVAWAEKELVQ